jgi:hypothetical protein
VYGDRPLGHYQQLMPIVREFGAFLGGKTPFEAAHQFDGLGRN